MLTAALGRKRERPLPVGELSLSSSSSSRHQGRVRGLRPARVVRTLSLSLSRSLWHLSRSQRVCVCVHACLPVFASSGKSSQEKCGAWVAQGSFSVASRIQ